jgi:P4 family phage/plasmid primase-like protien
MNEAQARLVFRLNEAEIPLNRFLEVNPDKSPREGKGYCDHLRTPEEMDKAGITRWGIMGGNFLVPIDSDKQEMADIIRKVLPRTFETLSVGRKLPHFYFLVWEKNGTLPPNGTLHIPNDNDEKGRPIGAGEIRIGNEYLAAPGTDVDYFNKKGEHIQGQYSIINDVPIAKMDYDDFTKALAPYRGSDKITMEEMKGGVASGFRHQKAMSYAYHLIANLRFGYDLALIELSRFGKLCDPPLTDQEYFDRALKAAISLEAPTQSKNDAKHRTTQEWVKILTDGQEQTIIDDLLNDAEDKLPNFDYFCDKDEKGQPLAATFQPAKVSMWLKEHRHFKTDINNGILYFFNGKCWIPNAEPYLEQILSKILGEYNKQHHFTNVLHALKGLTYEAIEFSRKIATPNGLMDSETLEIIANTPDEMPLFAIPTEYVLNSPYPQWQEWLNQVMPNKEDQMLLQEWSGYILLPDYRFHKLLFNYGTGRNGKGTWERTQQAVIGKNNCSEVALEEFNGFHRFALFQLYGKLLNLCSEPTTKYTLETSLIKKMTGQDTISAERKGSDKRVDFTNTAKITVTANKFPKVEDTTVAFKERRLFLNWEKEYLDSDGSQIAWIEQNWIQGEHDERKGILCWMLEGLQRLLSQGHFTQSKTQAETEILYQRASDSITAFKSEMMIFDKMLVTTRTDAFDAYKDYCDFYGLDAENEKKFTQALKETPKVSMTTTSKPTRLRAWKGFGVKILDSAEEDVNAEKPKEEQKTLDVPAKNVSDVSHVSRANTSPDLKNKLPKIEQYSGHDTSDTSDTQKKETCGDSGLTVEEINKIQEAKKQYCLDECQNFCKPNCTAPNPFERSDNAEIPCGCPGYKYVGE